MKVGNVVGLVGWRGMVGSVLMQRMQEEGDFELIEPLFFSTSNAGGPAPRYAKNEHRLLDGNDVHLLKRCDIVISVQGADYTTEIYPRLRAAGWSGFWIDAAKTLRMQPDAIIILDPVNRDVIDAALGRGVKNYIGGNCTVSCMLMGLGGLFKAGLVEWVNTHTYQAASGGGAANMRELIAQYGALHAQVRELLHDPQSAILEIDRQITVRQNNFSAAETASFRGVPLGGNLIAWIDSDRGDGTSLEEWKGSAETNKILGLGSDFGSAPIPIDSTCVRIGAMRCHSQSLTFKLKRDIPLADLQNIIASDNEWVHWVPNTREATERELTPAKVSGSMRVPVGRVRKLAMGPHYLGAFTVGDQLLWGAAEPLRRMLRILLD